MSKKFTKISIVFFIILLSILFNKTSNAETFQPIGIGTNDRNTTNAFYRTVGSDKQMWQYTKDNRSTVTENVYCASEGKSFVGSHKYEGYDLYYEKGKSDYSVISANYNKILWILDNAYVDKNVDSATQSAMIENLKKVTNGSVDSQIDYINSHAYKNELFYEITQCLLWSYTKNASNLGGITNIKYGTTNYTQAMDVYNALKKVADTKGNYESLNVNANEVKTYINSLSFDNTAAKIEGNVAGPFTLNNYNEKYNFPSEWFVTVNGKVNKDYSVRREGNKFYIEFNSNLPSTCNVNVDLVMQYIITTGKFWFQDDEGQELITVNKERVINDISANVAQSSKYFLDAVKLEYGSSNRVPGATISIKSENESVVYKTSKTGEDWGSLKTENFTTSKTFIITEDEAPDGYINSLSGIKIKLTVQKNGTSFNSYIKIYKDGQDVTSKYNRFVILSTLKSDDDSVRIGLYIRDIKNVNYNLCVIKRSAKTQKGLANAKFDVYESDMKTVKGSLVTATNGYSNFISYDVNDLNSGLSKIYVKEVEAPAGYELNNENEPIEIQPYVDEYGNITINEINTDTLKTYVQDIGGVQTITVEKFDSLKNGNYNIKIVKIDSKGNTVSSNETKFMVNDTELATTNGVLDVVTGKKITEDNQTDTYKITESVAPDGYGKYSGNISLNVIGKEDENGYQLNKDATYLEVNGEKVEQGKFSSDGFVYWDINDDTICLKLKNSYFDLALRKWVTEAIVTENGKTVTTKTGHSADDDPESVVKVDLKKSKLNDVVVKFKYSIRVTNEGEIAGEATEIRDDIPAGLKFVAEDNPDWKEENGQIVTNKLANTTLQPNESAEVEIILTWINSEKNMGVMINTAEINKDHNNYGAKDIDSTPGNKVPGEDDIDDAPVMITVKTGTYIISVVSLICGVVLILSIGIVFIKKKVISIY